MTTFLKVWALKSDVQLSPGATVAVTLKSGETKSVRVGAQIGQTRDGRFLYAPDGDQ